MHDKDKEQHLGETVRAEPVVLDLDLAEVTELDLVSLKKQLAQANMIIAQMNLSTASRAYEDAVEKENKLLKCIARRLGLLGIKEIRVLDKEKGTCQIL